MTRTTARRRAARSALRAFLLATLVLGLASTIACSSGTEPTPRHAFDAEVLDALDAAMTRLAEGRWPSWTMQIQAGQLAFRIEASAGHGEEARSRDCSALAKIVQDNVGARVPWRAEITRAGRLVKRCSEAPAHGRRVG
jgi:hypothetical protein